MKKSVLMTSPPMVEEPLPSKKKRTKKILDGLHKLYPEATCALEHVDAFQLLIATILSAQSRLSTK
jgi:endonuclease-3